MNTVSAYYTQYLRLYVEHGMSVFWQIIPIIWVSSIFSRWRCMQEEKGYQILQEIANISIWKGMPQSISDTVHRGSCSERPTARYDT